MAISNKLGWGAALAVLAAPPALARTTDVLIGVDSAAYFSPTGTAYRAQGKESVVVLDTSNAARPRIAANLPLSNSVLGPPTNLKVTPDGTLGLVSSAVRTEQKDGRWGTTPDNVVHIIDLSEATPRAIGQVKVGQQPSGMAISRDGRLALVANSVGRSVSVLRIAGKTVTHLADVPMNDTVVAVAITPDGRRALVAKSAAGRLGVLNIDGERVTYNPANDIPTGNNTFNVVITPDGTLGMALNITGGGHNGYINVIDLTGPQPRAIDTVAVGDGPEGFAIAPDGKSAVVLLLHGSNAAHNQWYYRKNGGIVGLRIDGKRVRVVPGEITVGGAPEGVVYSRDGRYVYAADFNDDTLRVIANNRGALRDTRTVIKLPGPPASMGGVD